MVSLYEIKYRCPRETHRIQNENLPYYWGVAPYWLPRGSFRAEFASATAAFAAFSASPLAFASADADSAACSR